MRMFSLIGMAGNKSHVIALPDVAVTKQIELRKAIINARGSVPDSKIKLTSLIHFSSDAKAKISRFAPEPKGK